MDVEPIKAGTKINTFWHEPVYYDIANTKLMAQMDGNGGFSKYSVAGKFNLLEDKSWFSGINVDGKRFDDRDKKTVVNKGKLQSIKYSTSSNYEITQELFPSTDDNILFNVMTFENNKSSTMNIDIQIGFLADITSYYEYKMNQKDAVKREKEKVDFGKNRFIYEVRDEYNLYFVSNLESRSMELHQNIFRLSYSFEVKPNEKKEFVIALSGATEESFDTFKSNFNNYHSVKKEILEEINWQENIFTSNDSVLNSMYPELFTSNKLDLKVQFFFGFLYNLPLFIYKILSSHNLSNQVVEM